MGKSYYRNILLIGLPVGAILAIVAGLILSNLAGLSKEKQNATQKFGEATQESSNPALTSGTGQLEIAFDNTATPSNTTDDTYRPNTPAVSL